VAIVAPYYKILDILEGDDLMQQREQANADALVVHPAGSLVHASRTLPV
jgi:hypothetical protein